MKLSIRTFAFALAVASVFSFTATRALAFTGIPGEDANTLNAEKIQILKSSAVVWAQPNLMVIGGNDTFNMKITFTNNGDSGSCDAGDGDLIGTGVSVSIAPGTCAQNYYTVFSWTIPNYVAKKVGGVQIGTYSAANGAGLVASKATTQWAPIGACGRWIIEFQATKLDLYKIQHNPIALRITDGDGSSPDCYDIYDALIGTGF